MYRVGTNIYDKAARGELTFKDIAGAGFQIVMDSVQIAGGIEGLGNKVSYCFVEGTPVETEDGQKPIEEIEVGDTVISEDVVTGEVAAKQVTEVFVNETDELVHVTVNGETISATPHHAFYVAKFGWTEAINLRAGDVLVLSNGEYVVVEAVQHEILESPVKVYNFDVEDYHTYFVGKEPVLVHNKCGGVEQDYSSWDEFVEKNKGDRGKGGMRAFLRDEKPINSPNVKKWFKKGGTIEIKGGKWIYKKVLSDNQLHFAEYDGLGRITFSDNSFYAIDAYARVKIDKFTGSRSGDISVYLKKTGLDAIPQDYELHHHFENGQLQLIWSEAHKAFSHKGGHSIFKLKK